jgi:low affinity Fe/Cu permease
MQLNRISGLNGARTSEEPADSSAPPPSKPVAEIILSALANAATKWTGSSLAFLLALGAIAIWAMLGPYFAYSDTWQLFINTGTSLITFLMVFLIQRAQNKDSQAIHLKLNELIAAVNGASNRLINVERMGEHDLQTLHEEFQKLRAQATQESSRTKKHTIEEATDLPASEP